MPYSKILLALAGKKQENPVIQEAVRLASELQAELSVLHVRDPSAGKISMMMEAEPLITENNIREQFRSLGFDSVANEITVHILTSSAVVKTLASAIADADLLVLGHHRKHRFTAALYDSIDERVADLVCGNCPILLVHQDEKH